MKLDLRYREGQFTPSETMAITGVALHLQRDWRSQGLLRPREGGRASFSPRELAEMRLMVKLRTLGLPLVEARCVAEEAAPGVVFAALANEPKKALVIEGSDDQASAYRAALEQEADENYLLLLADLPTMQHVYKYALVENGKCHLLKTLDEDAMDDDAEVAGLINLWAIARAIVGEIPRPLFTLIVPRNFRTA